MHFSYLDAYYHLATLGDKGAFDLLYKGVTLRAQTQVEAAGFKLSKHMEISANFEDYVDGLFFKMLNTYEQERGAFTAYVEYVLKTRLLNEVKRLYSIWKADYIDTNFDEAEHAVAGENEFNMQEDSIRRQIEVGNFKLRIASGNQNATTKKKKYNKLILMMYAGYDPMEIQKKLNLTKSQYRSMVQKVRKDDDVLNLKFELK